MVVTLLGVGKPFPKGLLLKLKGAAEMAENNDDPSKQTDNMLENIMEICDYEKRKKREKRDGVLECWSACELMDVKMENASFQPFSQIII